MTQKTETTGRRIIDIEAAVNMSCAFLREADTDTIASIFSETFGYNVDVEAERHVLICTPDKYCGGRLDEADFLVGERVIVPDPDPAGDVYNHSFIGTVKALKQGSAKEGMLAIVIDQDDNAVDIEVGKLNMELP